MARPLLQLTNRGIFCEKGQFYIDPWRPVDNAFITHAHSDHAHSGHKHYYSSIQSKPFIEYRLQTDAVTGLEELKPIKFGDVWVSLHPAGHVIGSSQVRVEYKDEVWVFTGDFKRNPELTCKPFEVVPCTHFISEATFALPIYTWDDDDNVADEMVQFASDHSGPTLIFAYAFGKSQRIISQLIKKTKIPIFQHGAVLNLSKIYQNLGVDLGELAPVPEKVDFQSITLAPPSAHRSIWMKRFRSPQSAFASGWMQVRAQKKRGGYDKGFVLSDHADWNDLVSTARDTGAEKVFLTHGQTDSIIRFLKDSDIDAYRLETEFSGETEQ